MFRYFILRPEQQLFCYLYGCALALVQMVLFSPVSRASGFYLVALSVALFWAGLALYTRHIDRMRKPEVSPLVSIRDGIQVVAEVPRHEKARLEWEIFRDDEVFPAKVGAYRPDRTGYQPGAVVYAGGDAGRYRYSRLGFPTGCHPPD